MRILQSDSLQRSNPAEVVCSPARGSDGPYIAGRDFAAVSFRKVSLTSEEWDLDIEGSRLLDSPERTDDAECITTKEGREEFCGQHALEFAGGSER